MSQQVRRVVVAAPSSNAARSFETNVRTWGELKEVIAELYQSNLDAVVPELNNASLSRNDASLPQGDFRVFLIPTKNKAGGSPADNLGKEIAKVLEEALKKNSENKLVELKEELISTIESFFDLTLDSVCKGCNEALAEARAYLNKN